MTSRRQQIELKPELLRWARERAGLTPEQLAEKMNVKPERVLEWEIAGEISIAQADRLAAKTYTPLGYLYLSNPPTESLPIRDFRTRGDSPVSQPSVDLLDTVYQMQRRQAWMRDDLIENDEDSLPFVGAYSLQDSHTEVAAAMRATLGLAAGWAKGISTWSDALRFLRNKLDEVGVLVVFSGVVGNSNRRKLDPGGCLRSRAESVRQLRLRVRRVQDEANLRCRRIAHVFSGCFGLESCEKQNRSIREGTRIGAKNTRGNWDFSCVIARISRTLLPQIAVQPNVNEP